MKKLYAALMLLVSFISFSQIQLTPLPQYLLCGNNNNGYAVFDLTTVQQALYTEYPANTYSVAFYINQTAAEANTQLPLQYTNSVQDMQILVVKVWETANPTNLGYANLTLVVGTTPVANDATLVTCDDNNDGIAMFNLTNAEEDITDNQPGYSVSYYASLSDMENGIPIAQPYAYENTGATTTAYAQVQNMSGCSSVASITLTVTPRPFVSGMIPAINSCGTIDLTTNNALYSNYTATYHTTPIDAFNGENAIADPTQYTSSTPSGTIWIRITSPGTDCYTIASQPYNTSSLGFNVTVTQNGSTAIIETGNGLPTTYTIITAPNTYANEVPFEQNTHILTNLTPGGYTLSVQDMCGNVNMIMFEIADAPFGEADQYFTQGDTLEAVFATGDNIQWYADAALTQPITTDVMLADGTTYYAVQVINGNKSIPLAVTVHLVSGTDSVNKNTIALYPNPASTAFTVTANSLINHIEVYTITGQMVATAIPNTVETQVNISNFQQGIYIVKIQSGLGSKTLKVIKE